MVARAEEGGTGASVVLAPTHLGTVARADLLEGQWRLVKLLGQGEVGQVFQAHDVTLDRAVAVKLMHQAVAADPAQVARFEREARVLAALEHPNLLPVLGIGRLDDRPFLVTRLLEGLTLAELMHQRGGKLPPSEAARVLAPICDALDCLHQASVVHRDLKPSNIFVSDDRRVTLMDLGSAHELGSELTHFGQVLGTLGYLSPEQKLGKRDLDGKSDVYALGCLLLEVLTGEPTTDSSAAPGVPAPLVQVAKAAMALSPAERPTALELKAKLVPYLIPEEPTVPIGKPLAEEAPTHHVVFTPTTGSPAYPHLRALVSPEPETKEAPRTNYGPRPALGVVPQPSTARGSGGRPGASRSSGPKSRGSGARPPPSAPRTDSTRPSAPRAGAAGLGALVSGPASPVRADLDPGASAVPAELGSGPTFAVPAELSTGPASAVPAELGSGPVPADLSSGPTRASVAARAGPTMMMLPRVRSSPPLSRGAVAVLGLVALAILGAFGLGLAEPELKVPPPVRVDNPAVVVPIQREALKIAQIIEAPRVATVYVPNLAERKSEANSTYGYEKRVVKRPNRSAVKPGSLRVTTTISDFVVPSVMWVKRNPNQKLWELVGQTPVELQVVPGELSIRLQYEDDPFIHLPYRVLPRKDWPREVGGMRLELAVRDDATTGDEPVSRGEQMAGGVSRSSTSVKPMTNQRPRGGR